MKYFFLILLFTVCSYKSVALHFQQDTVFNQTDSKGLKMGHWKKYYPNGNLMYQGFFKDDRPVGEMKRYFESGNLKAIMVFNEKADYSSVRIFYEDGTLASDGFYADSRKDSIWNYYSYYDKELKSRETYKNGLKNGFSYEYYPGGSCFEKTEWKNNLKDGIREQYYEDGSVRLRANYSNDKLTGHYLAFYSNGRPMVTGQYENDRKEGIWVYYNENGSVNQEISFSAGKPLNEKELTRKQQEFFRKIDENMGKFTEPEPSEFLPRNRYNGNEY